MPDERDLKAPASASPAPPPERPHDTDPAIADTSASTPEESGARIAASAVASSPSRGPRSVRTGDSLGRYDLLDEVGEGGMATVFRARDRELRRDVAIKVLFPHLARRDEIVRRFHREARAAASLEHPHILRIYDVGGAEGDDPPYIVMELIRGRTLLEEVEARGPLLAEMVACIGALLADALAVAHAAGIVHRDIKPANVLVTSDGRLLLADFGVARIENEDSLVTKTGALLGTPAYMSPEQARGEVATARSDVYSLGATLYQLATGSLPYAGSPAKVIAAITTGPPTPALRRRPAVGPDLSRVIERTMASDPAARIADAAAVAAELRPIVTAGGLGDPADEMATYFADPTTFLRERTPSVVSALVTAAERAIADERLPRAMALADRASALAPQDPAVSALISNVTEGGRSRVRRKWLAIGGACVAVVGGAIALAVNMHGGGGAPRVPRVVADASAQVAVLGVADAASAAVSADASVIAAPIDAAVAASTSVTPSDAGAVRRDANSTTVRTHADAAIAAIPVDAAVVAQAIDAAPAAPDAALVSTLVPERGAIIVDNDTWCEITIDGATHGRVLRKPLHVDAGHHVVMCAQPGTGRQWTQEVDVVAGQTVTAHGSLLGTFNVTLAVRGTDVIINGVHYRPGMVAPVKGGRPEIIDVGVAKAYVDIRQPCTLRDTDDRLSCDP